MGQNRGEYVIPTNNIRLNEGFEIKTRPSFTYRLTAAFPSLITQREKVTGKTDRTEAMKQAIYKILMTERYDYIIYSHNYGVELADLIGQQISYVKAVLPGRIREALLMDDRITGTEDFVITEVSKGELLCEFTALTIFGNVKSEVRVNV